MRNPVTGGWLAIVATIAVAGCGSSGRGSATGDLGGGEVRDAIGDAGGLPDVAPARDTTADERGRPDDSGTDAGDARDEGDDVPSEDRVDVPAADAGDAGVPDGESPQTCTLSGQECPPGEHCVPAGDLQSLVCRPSGTTPPGGPCQSHEDCAEGLGCVPYDEGVAFCKPLCSIGEGGVACPDDDQVCLPSFGPGGATAGACLGSDCTPPGQGCPEGQRCTVLANQVLECVPAGPVGPGGDCTSDECQAGTLCLVMDGAARCRPFCRGASDCVEPEDHCVFPWPFTDFGFCRPGCDPVTQEGCPPGQGCYFSDPEVGSTLCWNAGTLEEGADCSNFAEFCKPGLDCILQPGSDPYEYYCRAYCDSEHQCPSGQSCQFPPASPVMGVCL